MTSQFILGNLTEREQCELVTEYANGKLVSIEHQLWHFLITHRDEIHHYRIMHAPDLPADLKAAMDQSIQGFIMEHRSLDVAAENLDQREEIMKEKWIRREHGSHESTNEIAMEWTLAHARAWRLHRIHEIFFVYEKKKETYVALLTPNRV